jgi:hypothetical protein
VVASIEDNSTQEKMQKEQQQQVGAAKAIINELLTF